MSGGNGGNDGNGGKWGLMGGSMLVPDDGSLVAIPHSLFAICCRQSISLKQTDCGFARNCDLIFSYPLRSHWNSYIYFPPPSALGMFFTLFFLFFSFFEFFPTRIQSFAFVDSVTPLPASHTPLHPQLRRLHFYPSPNQPQINLTLTPIKI